jgi:ribosomal protein S18 acetylase RimI-like enzyme
MYEGDGLRIRKATQEDTRAIVELWKEMMDFHRERDRHFTRSVDGHERFAEFVSGRIVSETSCVLVAEQQCEIVGYCLATLSKFPPVFEYQKYGAIFDLAVTENYRKKGIGQALVEAAVQWLSEQEIHRVEVRVATSNKVSIAFWKKIGFVPYLEVVYKEI